MLKEFMQEIENLLAENERLRAELRKAKAEAWDEALRSFADQVDEVQSMWIEAVTNPYRDLTVHRLEVAKPGASVWSQGSRRFAKRGDGQWTDMLGPGLYDSEQVLSIVPDGKLTHE